MTFSRELWRFTQGVRGRIALAVAVGLFAVAAGVARLALLGWIAARIFEGDGLEELAPLIVAAAAAVIATSVAHYVKEEIANGTALEVQFALRQRLFDQVARLGPAHFDRQRTGDVTVGVIEGVEQLETFFGQYLPQLIVATLAPLGIFVFMGWLDLPVAGVYLAFALATLLVPSLLKQRNAEASLRRRDAYGSFAADFLDSVQGLATLKAFGQSSRRGEALAQRAHEVFRSTMGVLVNNAIAQGLTILAITVGAAVALLVGALRVESGAMELAELVVVLMLGVEVFRPLRELSQLFHQGLLGVAAAESVLDIDRAQPLTPDADAPPVPDLEPSIEFDNVTFSYPTGRRPALSGVSFTVEPGRRIGVVGRSGSGKSTLVWLLQRLYTPQEGTIRLGGHDLNDLRFEDIRAQMAVVLQDTYLFHGSVLANLRFAKPDATDDEIRAAARAANAHEFITNLPEGYATVIGERGHRLAGGERQRIAIARALLRDAPILILDEALSSVDAENEATIQAALDELMQGRTTLIMAHRLSSVRACDEILVLDDGRLVERGDHETLLKMGGVYDWLMAGQMTDPSLDEWAAGAPAPEPAAAIDETGALTARDDASGATEAIIRAEGMGWRETSARLLGLAAPYWLKTTLTFVTGVAYFLGSIAVGVIGALMVANVREGESIGLLAVLLMLVAVLTGLFRFLENWVSHDMAFRLLADMRIDLFRKLDQLAPAYLLRRRTGDLVSMATQDVETVEYFFAHTIANAFVSLVVPGAALVTLFVVDWRLGLGLAPLLVVAGLSPLFTRSIVDRLGSRSRDHLGALNAHMVDTLQGLPRGHGVPARTRAQGRVRGVDARVPAGAGRVQPPDLDAADAARGPHRVRRPRRTHDRRGARRTRRGRLVARPDADAARDGRVHARRGAGAGGASPRRHPRRDATPHRGTQRARGRPRRARGSGARRWCCRRRGLGRRVCSRRLRLRGHAAGGARCCLVRPATGRHGRARRPLGRGQDHGGTSHAALSGTRRTAASRSKTRTCAATGSTSCAARWRSWRRTPTCSTPRSATTSASPGPTRARTSSCSRSSAPASPISSSRCRTGSTRRWVSAARSSRAGSDSASPSGAPC